MKKGTGLTMHFQGKLSTSFDNIYNRKLFIFYLQNIDN